ncbi:hypothetical protein SRB17_79390 [Streptomyces sp. RB17]|uniref:hypothetical protein n=1 Tax=Streptomyces sp. RB17 TaxID=2585197 RepID=UPI00130A4CF1|nr:hypothetical protein [Streptomyces sp. RB17]MQY39911.1 hypothetical protein [Streptomyces sp. RB17]
MRTGGAQLNSGGYATSLADYQTCWNSPLTQYKQAAALGATFVLMPHDMAGGNDVSATTIRRWRYELITLLAAKAPRLDRALKKIARRGGEVVLIDGTLIPTQRAPGRRTGRTPRAVRMMAVSFRPWPDSYSGWLLVPCV